MGRYSEKNEPYHDDLKVHLPVPIDSRKYLVGRIAFVDVFIASPFVLITALFLFGLWKLGLWNNFVAVLLCVPAGVVVIAQTTKHKVRKEISFIQYGVIWKYLFKKREKVFVKRKGTMDMSDTQDARRVIGVKGTFADCYETSKNLVRVFETSSVNLSLSNKQEKRSSLESFKVFLTSSDFYTRLQICKIAQPINLERHLINFNNERAKSMSKINELNPVASQAVEMLAKSYQKEIHNISKNRDLVTRKNYLILSQPIKGDRERALEILDGNSKLLMSKLQGMIFEQTTLQVKQLNNEELTLLLHTCVDFDSSVSVGQHILKRTDSYSEVTMGEETARQLATSILKQLDGTIQ